jgi:protein-L-isoaspartate O-methyltransferase
VFVRFLTKQLLFCRFVLTNLVLLVGFGVIRTPQIEAAFRAVDRKFFVPTVRCVWRMFYLMFSLEKALTLFLFMQKQSHLAYTDQPIREGNIHISAPHIYGTILEALDLPSTEAGSTFLNLGSGTGYLTCLVTQVMGPQTIAYNVELQDEPFRHGQHAVQQWQHASRQTRHPPKMVFLQGNGLMLHPSEGEACMGFDRIYVGAALELEALQPIANLLRPNGVLVCPGKSTGWRGKTDSIEVVRHSHTPFALS